MYLCRTVATQPNERLESELIFIINSLQMAKRILYLFCQRCVLLNFNHDFFSSSCSFLRSRYLSCCFFGKYLSFSKGGGECKRGVMKRENEMPRIFYLLWAFNFLSSYFATSHLHQYRERTEKKHKTKQSKTNGDREISDRVVKNE